MSINLFNGQKYGTASSLICYHVQSVVICFDIEIHEESLASHRYLAEKEGEI